MHRKIRNGLIMNVRYRANAEDARYKKMWMDINPVQSECERNRMSTGEKTNRIDEKGDMTRLRNKSWVYAGDCTDASDRVAHCNNCRMSPDGGVSAGRLGSTSKLGRRQQSERRRPRKSVPATVQILQVGPVLGLLESVLEIVLYLGDLFQVVRYLETLHV